MSLPRVLFVCYRNAGKSKLAEALWRDLGGEARSAAPEPAATAYPEVGEALAEAGVTVPKDAPRRITPEDLAWAELVVSFGCADAVPAGGGARREDWALPGGAGHDLETVRAQRDELRRHLQARAGAEASP